MKVNISTASKRKLNRFPIDTFHLSTLGFGRTIVSNIIPLEQGEKVKGKFSQFFRLSPLPVPTYGNARIVTRAFCVPFRVVTRNWDNFYSGTDDATLHTEQPSISNAKLVDFFLSAENSLTEWKSEGRPPITERYDVTIFADGDYQNYNFTERGRWLFQVLQGLGYGINWDDRDTTLFEFRPILAFMRCCYDYLYPSRWINHLSIGTIFETDIFDDGTIEMTLNALVDLLFVPYMQDNYNSAWLTFNSPDGSTPTGYNVQNAYSPVSNEENVASDKNATVLNTTDSQRTISAYALRNLQAVSDVVTRDNIAGSRYFERVKAEFGFVTLEQKHSYSQFLKSYNHSINLMDVTATSASDNQLLGEQAAKGYVNGSDMFSFKAKEHCYVIFITQIMPSIGYYQGRKPWTIFKDSRFKYYRPEFDTLGMEPLRNDELFADFNILESRDYGSSAITSPNEFYTRFVNNGGKPNGVFGFRPRYMEYKQGYDYVTGDFRLRSRNRGSDCYHTMRVLTQPSSTTPLANNADFLRVTNEYNRIFAVDPQIEGSANYDHFVGYFSFQFTKYSPKLSVSESIPLFNKSGQDVTLDYEGTQL